MALNLNIGGTNGGIKKLLGITAGILTGGVAGAAAGIGSTAGSVIGGLGSANPNSPLGKAVGIYKAGDQASDVVNKLGGESTPQTDQNFKQPEMGSQFKGQSPSLGGDAMSRSLQAQQQNPTYLVHQGLQHLNNPDVYNSMPHDQYMSYVEPLLRAQHFGMGGGLDNSSGNGGMA